jgi:hypothetical protein
MATKILGFGDAFRALAAESGTMRGHPMMNTTVHYAIESDEDAAVLQAEATQDAAEMATDIAAADEAIELGDSANEAGDVFALAAVDETVPEAMIAQADTVASEVAEAGDVPLTTVLPDITDADRTMSDVVTESSTGRRIRRPMYGAIRQNKAGLQRCAESMWTSAKAIFSNAWDSIVKAYRKFCQWVDKYIGTFARLRMKVESLMKDAKKMDGMKIKSGEKKLEISSGNKNLAVPADSSAEVTYITTGKALIGVITEFNKDITKVIEMQRSQEDAVTKFSDALSGADFTDKAEAGKSYEHMQDATVDILTKFKNAAGTNHMSKHDTTHAKAYCPGVLPGYQRILFMLPDNITDNPAATSDGMDAMTDKFNAVDLKVVDGDPELKKTIKETIQFEAMSPSDIEELANVMKKGVDEIVQYRSSKQYLKNEAAVRRLKDTLEKTDTRRVNTSDEDADKYSRAAGKATVAMARATMRMLNVPTRMITFYDTYVNFCIGLGRKSMSAYETR